MRGGDGTDGNSDLRGNVRRTLIRTHICKIYDIALVLKIPGTPALGK